MPLKKNNPNKQHILICRTDAIGDIVLALPVCGIIKEAFPDCKISVLGRTYTRDIALASSFVDNFINHDDWNGKSDDQIKQFLQSSGIDVAIHLKTVKSVAFHIKNARIKLRIGTTNRLYHWIYCNKLVVLSRKKSGLHEAQLNLKLLTGLDCYRPLSLKELPDYYGLTRFEKLDTKHRALLSANKFNLILHPKTHGNSLEWDLENFSKLIGLLDKSRFNIFISGSAAESKQLNSWIKSLGDEITDVSGTLSLAQFISFINEADGLVAGSTGPVHIAAAAGINTLGLYTDIKTRDGGRWGPVGKKAGYIECKNADMNTITVAMVLNRINDWIGEAFVK